MSIQLGSSNGSERDVQSASCNRSSLIMTGSTACGFQSAEIRNEVDIKQCTVAISQTRSSWQAVWETKLTILWCSSLQSFCSETWCKWTMCLYHIQEIVHTKGLWEIPYFHPIQLYNTACFQKQNSTLLLLITPQVILFATSYISVSESISEESAEVWGILLVHSV